MLGRLENLFRLQKSIHTGKFRKLIIKRHIKDLMHSN